MNHRLLAAASAGLLCCLVSGCFVKSFHPFCTEDQHVPLPGLDGTWALVQTGKEDVREENPDPWVFSQDTLVTYEDGVPSTLGMAFFRAGKGIFVDLYAGAPDEERSPNIWWVLHVTPVHSVCKVELDGNVLELIPLSAKFVTKQLEQKPTLLPHVMSQDDELLLTADTPTLNAFISKWGGEAAAFDRSNRYLFHRAPAKAGSSH